MPSPRLDLDLALSLDSPYPLRAQLQCAGGELLALVGSSGSGKSSLLRLIAGLARPTHGHIQCGEVRWFDSARRIHLPPQQRGVGFVPQHYGLFPHMTALGNVMAGLHALPSREREARARLWMEKVHLQGLETRRPAEMSGGQQQRVALARALVREPSLLLLDEPFSAVDRVTRETLCMELAELKRELSLPIIMVTHDLGEALLLADRMTLIADGHTLQSGVPREVMTRPVSTAAARQLGIRNIHEGIVLRHDVEAGQTWLDAGGIPIACPRAAFHPAGARVNWMVPVEGVRLELPGTAPAARNHIPIVILNVLALGEHARITAQLPHSSTPLHLQVPRRLADTLGLRPGLAVEAVLDEEHIHVFPGKQG